MPVHSVVDVHLLATKDQALEAWELTRTRWECQYNRQVKAFQSDNGGEFVSTDASAKWQC